MLQFWLILSLVTGATAMAQRDSQDIDKIMALKYQLNLILSSEREAFSAAYSSAVNDLHQVEVFLQNTSRSDIITMLMNIQRQHISMITRLKNDIPRVRFSVLQHYEIGTRKRALRLLKRITKTDFMIGLMEILSSFLRKRSTDPREIIERQIVLLHAANGAMLDEYKSYGASFEKEIQSIVKDITA